MIITIILPIFFLSGNIKQIQNLLVVNYYFRTMNGQNGKEQCKNRQQPNDLVIRAIKNMQEFGIEAVAKTN